MAILKKRTSSKKLPETRGLDRAPLDSVIRGVSSKPSIADKGASSITSKTTSTPKTSLTPRTSLTTTSTPKTSTAPTTSLTSTTTPKANTTPTITNKTTTTPTTKTTSPTSVVKPTVKPNVSNPNSTTNKVVNALTGAALGAGTKLIIDKITGKPTTTTTTGAGKTTTAPNNPQPNKPVLPNKNTGTANNPSVPPKPAEDKKTPPVTSKVLTDKEVQDELDKAKALEEPWTPPSDAIKNADGTYTVYDGNIKTTYNSDGSVAGMEAAEKVSGAESLAAGETLVGDDGITVTAVDVGNGQIGYVYGGYNKEGIGPKSADPSVTRGLGGNTATSENTTVSENTTPEYFQDEQGNYYTMNANGGYDLAYYADGTAYSTDNTTVSDNTWTDPETGAVWTMADNGEWDTDFNYDEYYAGQDTSLADNTDYADNSDYTLADNSDYTDYSDYDYAKSGGLITMMKNGGVPHFENGGEVYMPYGAEDNGDGTYTIGNNVYDMMTGDPLYTMNDSGGIMYVEPSVNSNYVDNGDGTYTMNGITYDVMTDMPLYADRASGGVDLAKDNGDGTYTIGNQTYDMATNEPLYTTNPRTRSLNVNPGAISSVGSGTRAEPTLKSYLDKGVETFKGVAKDGYEALTGALGTTAGAAGAGALVATLLGQDFSGGTGNQNQGLDMSKVGVINPRTTDFGIGPTNFVGYEDYGTSNGDYTPNAELLKNLNAPGYNPVNEGDYGYEEVPAEEETPKMASGGLSSMATPVSSYYTFGQPADILANLGMRAQPPMNPPDMMPQIGQQQPAQQAQQQGLPQQMPPQMAQQTPQGMPQQGMMPQQQGMAPPMRKGGLPHASNVPIVEGRMDFRKGSAVHGAGDGQSDDIPAMLADGEYVIDAETVAQIGNGSTKAGAQALDKFRENIRAHKRSAPVNKIPPKTKALTSYLKGAK